MFVRVKGVAREMIGSQVFDFLFPRRETLPFGRPDLKFVTCYPIGG